MRKVSLGLALALLLASSARAQTQSQNPVLKRNTSHSSSAVVTNVSFGSPAIQSSPLNPRELFPALPSTNASPEPFGSSLFALAAPGGGFTPLAAAAEPSSSASAAGSLPLPQGPKGVSAIATYPFEAYLGYSFVRFYQVPGSTLSRNGFVVGLAYYPADWIGAEGEFTFTDGSLNGQSSRFELALGGVRVRRRGFRGWDLWGHALAGGAESTPQTAYGGQKAFAAEAGIGADLNFGTQRLALRVGADGVFTRFYGTYQVSPKISGGIVFRF